jgi:hypothetical protein
MATDNIQVTAYLPEHLIEYLNKYCTEYGITRKKDNKPMLGTAIVDLLNIVANIPLAELTAFNTGNLPKNNLDDLIEKKVLDSTLLSKLLDKVLSEDSLRARLEGALLPKSNPTSNNSTLNNNVPVQYFNDEEVLTDTLPSKVSAQYFNDEPVLTDTLPSKVPVKSNEDDIKEADTGKGNHNDSADFSKSEDIPESKVRKDTVSDYEKSLSNFAIDTKAKTVKENANNIYVTESQNLKEDNQQLPLDIDVQETIKNEDTITPEKEKDSLEIESKRAKKVKPNIKPLKPEIIDKINLIPVGKTLTTQELCEAIGIDKANLSRYFESKYSTYFKKEKTGNSKNSQATYIRL